VEIPIHGGILEQHSGLPSLAHFPSSGQAMRFGSSGRFSMGETLTGPILYLVIAWGVVTAVFIILLIWRALLASHEDDQIFLDAAEEHMAREQRELVAKIGSLSRPIATSGIAAGALLLVIVGMWLYEGLKSF